MSADWSGYPLTLIPEHAALLDASAVTPRVAERRQVRSIVTKKDARNLGLRGDAERPGLWFPRWTTRGEQEGGQLRPNDPRQDRDGRVIKYESPSRQPLDLDIHPDARHGNDILIWPH